MAFQQITLGTLKYLECAWVLLGIAIVLTLFSFMTSQLACKTNIDIMEDNTHKNRNVWSNITNILNYTTIIIFIIGLFSLTSFGFLNVYQKEGKAMTDKKVELEKIKEGFVPPSPPEKSNPKKTPKGPPKEK